jgi:alcohol dehydrogenase class IV
MSAASRFEFAAPGRIIFGAGASSEAGPAIAALARGASRGESRGAGRGASRAFFISPPGLAGLEPFRSSLEAAGVERVDFPVLREPRFEDLRAALEAARAADCGLVIGCGGGSAMDMAKALAALLANPGDPLDYAEVIGGGKALAAPSFPCVAIPTTAGTGAEATRNAVFASEEAGVKVSLRSPTMMPALAVVDPGLCLGLPPRATADTGLDALAQLLEPLVCSSPSPLVDALCRGGLGAAAASLLRAYRDGSDLEARSGMSYASLSGGMALANARLGAVHGIAGPLGGAFPVPHGAACAALLAPVASANVAALRSREPGHPALGRYAQAAALLGGRPSAEPEEAAALLGELAAALGVRPLRDFGLGAADLPGLVPKAQAASSMRGNPVKLTDGEILAVLERAL